MDSQGMVHALRKIRGLLEPEGVLVNIQPVGEPRPIEIRAGAERIPVGFVQHSTDFADHKRAQLAVETSLQQGLFDLEQAFTFTFLYYAPTFAELERWLREEVNSAVLPEATVAQGRSLWESAGPGSAAVMRDEILVMRLRPA